MDQSNSKPRFVVREKASKSGRGTWAVCDRTTRKVDSRYCYRASAEQVAQSLNDIERDRLAGTPWPIEAYASRWAIVPPVEPAEASDVDEVDPADRRDWATMSNDATAQDLIDDREWDEAHEGTLLASLDSGLSAFLDRLEADYLERDIPEPELAEFGVIARR